MYPWGKYPAEVSDAALRYAEQATAIARTLLGWVEDNTPAEVSDRFSRPLNQMMDGSTRTLLRVLRYPPLRGDEPAGAVRAAAHEDINLLTVLPAANEPGLQVRDLAGNWHDVPCDFGSLAINCRRHAAVGQRGVLPVDHPPGDEPHRRERDALPPVAAVVPAPCRRGGARRGPHRVRRSCTNASPSCAARTPVARENRRLVSRWRRPGRRRQVDDIPFPDEWRHAIARRWMTWHVLSLDERARLEALITEFVGRLVGRRPRASRSPTRCRVVIAAQACLLVLELDLDHYRRVASIIVHPRTMVHAWPAPCGRRDDERRVHRRWPGRPTTVGRCCWRGARPPSRPATPSAGMNVVFHEFAHQLDMLDGTVDGTPPLGRRGAARSMGGGVHRRVRAAPPRATVDRRAERAARLRRHRPRRVLRSRHRDVLHPTRGVRRAEARAVRRAPRLLPPGPRRTRRPSNSALICATSHRTLTRTSLRCARRRG